MLGALPLQGAHHRSRVYPNPSIAILSITEGPDGALWLAAEDGLYRFDGFHFQKVPGFPFTSARIIGATADGALWIGGREGLVRYRGVFEILLRENIHSMVAFPDHVVVRVGESSLLRLRTDGATLRHEIGGSPYITAGMPGRIWVTTNKAELFDSDGLVRLGSRPLPFGFTQVAQDPQGRLWAADHSRASEIDPAGKELTSLNREPSQRTDRPPPLIAGRNGEPWFLGETIRGLGTGQEFHDRLLNDQYLPTAGYEDRRGHFWVARLGLGLVEWTPDVAWERWFPERLHKEQGLSVTRAADGSLVAATHAGLYRLGPGREWMPLHAPQGHYDFLLALSTGGFAASIRGVGLAWLSRAGELTGRAASPLPSDRDDRVILRDAKNRFWLATKAGLLLLDERANLLHTVRLPGQNGDQINVADLELDQQGGLWAGYEEGIARLDDQDRWQVLPTTEPIARVRSFALDGGQGKDIWVAYRDPGRFSRLREQDGRWRVSHFESTAGYGVPDTHFVKRDSRGWIWRGATDGVHVSDGAHTQPNDWLHFGLLNGLATDSTDMYGFFENSDGSVWITGEQGITHLKPDLAWFDAPRNAPPPRITILNADGRVFIRGDVMPHAFQSRPRLLRLEVGSLDAPPFRDYPFRYRLLPSMPEWQLSRDGALEFQNLPAAAYRLEVEYAGTGSSPTLQFAFRVGPPASRLSWLWLLAIPAALAVAVIVRYTPAFEKFNYRVHKALFLFRRRLSAGDPPESAEFPGSQHDYTGETLLGRYRLLQEVSRGGFSVVYEARDLTQGTARVAVKIINVSAHDESWVRDRFAYEVASLRSVNHQGVVPILDSWVSPHGEPCLAMLFLDGPTLREEMAGRTFRPERVARIVRKLGSVLAEIHSRGIIHRDLKPENVILLASGTEEERPVLIDFGMASLRGGENRMWNTTLLGGSFHYLAPERLTGHYSQASDVYSFGVMILEMLSGNRLPDLNVMISDDSFPDALGRALGRVVVPANLPRLVRNLCLCYAAEPQRRPKDVGLWAEEVAALLDMV